MKLAKPYNQYQSYKAGEYILFNGSNTYICLQDAEKQQSPTTSSRNWQQVFNSSALSPSGVTAGTYGDATNSAQITVDVNGIITNAVDVPIAGGAGTVTIVSVVSANGFGGTVATATTTPAITLTTSVTGILIGNGTAVSAATNADITGKLLTGYVSGAGVVAATDSILQGIQKLNGNITALVTGVSSVNSLTGAVALTGTANRVTISGANVFDISASYDALWQPVDADLTAIAALGFASLSFLKKTAANTWALDTNTYLTTVTPHDILSATHSDTLASAVTRGSIIVGNATPLWAELNLGTAGKILRSDGTDLVYSTSTFADTYTASNLLYSNGANTVTGLATANDSVLVTGATGIPALSTTLPAVTLNTATIAVTQAANDNSTKIATTAYVDAAAAIQMSGTFGNTTTVNPADSTSYFWGTPTTTAPTGGGTRRLYVTAGSKVYVTAWIIISGTLGSAETVNWYIRVNNTTDYALTTSTFNVTNHSIVTSVAIALSAGDYIELKATMPAFATNPTIVQVFGTLTIQ